MLGVRHERRTEAILALPELRDALAAIDVDAADVLALITGSADADPVLRELVSGPNLDADRMDYLLRDAYFTGVAGGTYDAEQLIASLRVLEVDGLPQLGVDGRGVVALESFVLARYMMFATVYFHHTTRAFERVLQDVLDASGPIRARSTRSTSSSRWDDFRVSTRCAPLDDEGVRALRERHTIYGLAAEFNAERDLRTFERCERALRERWGDAVWSDSQEQLLHRLAARDRRRAPTVRVQLMGRVVDARAASDLIAKLSGKAYWRKLFVRTDVASVAEARAICAEIIATGGQPRLL